ncbi:ABC transporter substrate-binding protein [Methanococcus maripaludis]|uniref:ABC transporter substrate-binding protein n=1 Tax=Methanococcus maripaludis TaxID=39152 RepID=UPI00064EBF4C|nr:ABC transporter substrate-binding protein [Methanococcus maripaludis]
MKKLNGILAILCIMAALVFAGCTEQQASEVSEEEPIVTVYVAYGGLDLIAEEFEKDTGIKMEYVSLSSGEALSRLKAEQSNPSADVWLGGGIDAFISAQNDGLLEAYKSPNAEEIDPLFVEENGYWIGVSLVTIGILENTDLMTEKGLPEPETWDDLITEDYSGELIASNPTVSGTAYFTICGILQMNGEEEGWNYLDKFYQNTPFLTKRGSGPGNLVTAGEYAYGVAPDPHTTLIANSELPVKSVFLDNVIWWPSPVSIVNGAKHPENAKIFVDWCLSKEGQEVLMQASPRVPVRGDIEVIEGVPNPEELNFIDMDFVYWGENRDRILDEWESRYREISTTE